MAQDISEDQMISGFRESNSLEKLLIENADEALFFYTMEGKLIYVNSAFEKITGYTTQEMYEKNFIPYIHPDDQGWTMKLWEGLFKGEFFEDAEFRIIKKNGEIRWSSSTWKLVINSDGKKIGIQGKQQDITERKLSDLKLEEAIQFTEKLANKDELTGLNNRRSFFEKGNQIFKQAIRYEHPLSVIMMDVDHFKNINDEHGHSVGDEVLQGIAQLLQITIREIDLVARMGGEEFAFLFPETLLDEAVHLTERLRKEIECATIVEKEKHFRLTASFGICSSQVKDETLEAMLSKADDALYIAKKKGRNQIKTSS